MTYRKLIDGALKTNRFDNNKDNMEIGKIHGSHILTVRRDADCTIIELVWTIDYRWNIINTAFILLSKQSKHSKHTVLILYQYCGYNSICGNNNPGLIFNRDLHTVYI